ncbi:MAG TPA: CARDB domain-containing protein, partial [Candidatus Nanoarchaeia archaeon]|nr:CARDB domain-containing protein [Candidatus Nanoarchaeia archaeon]
MRGWLALFVLLAIIPLAYPMSQQELIQKYSFSAETVFMNITNSTDFMIDRDNDGVYDLLVLELTTFNTPGNFIFSATLDGIGGDITNETNTTLPIGTNKLNLTFDSFLLNQDAYNYSIKVYNSSYSLKYRKDKITTNEYPDYEGGFKILSISDYEENKDLKINLTVDSPVNGTFETIVYLYNFNKTTIFEKENKTLTSAENNISVFFAGDRIKKLHKTGSFKVSSVKINSKKITTNHTTNFYDYRDFGTSPYISGFSDKGIDENSNGKYELLQISAKTLITFEDDYSIYMQLYDLFDNFIDSKNITEHLNAGNRTLMWNVNGTKIKGKKLNGPYAIKQAFLFENGVIVDEIEDYTTSSYNFDDFENPNLPDIKTAISVSDGYRYNSPTIDVNVTLKNIGILPAFNVFADIFDNKSVFVSNVTNILLPGSSAFYQFEYTNESDFDITAIADLLDSVEEINESNNAQRFEVKFNKKPNINQIQNITVNEGDEITINISAYDSNNDFVYYSINSSKLKNNSNIFHWNTTAKDSGEYFLQANASDRYLFDYSLFKITVVNNENDTDNDGINDSDDAVIGDSVSSSLQNLSVFIDGSSDFSSILRGEKRIKFRQGNAMLAEFDINLSLYRINLSNITLQKQPGNSTGWLIFRGIKMPLGYRKTLYIDKVNSTNGICIKDADINSVDEISDACNLENEFKIECDGALQGSYRCTYNSSSGKYKIEGLKHSGIQQINYEAPEASSPTAPVSSASTSSGSSGGG